MIRLPDPRVRGPVIAMIMILPFLGALALSAVSEASEPWYLLHADTAGPIFVRSSQTEDRLETLQLVIQSRDENLLRVRFENEVDCGAFAIDRVDTRIYDALTGDLVVQTSDRIPSGAVPETSVLGLEVQWFCGLVSSSDGLRFDDDIAARLISQWPVPVNGQGDWVQIARNSEWAILIQRPDLGSSAAWYVSVQRLAEGGLQGKLNLIAADCASQSYSIIRSLDLRSGDGVIDEVFSTRHRVTTVPPHSAGAFLMNALCSQSARYVENRFDLESLFVADEQAEAN